MRKHTPSIIRAIRQAKLDGKSLKQIAEMFGCAKSTASLYCRDVFEHPNRLYQSEQDARAAILRGNQLNPNRSRGTYRTYYPCIECGKLIRRNGSRCIVCHSTERKRAAFEQYIKRCEERQILKDQRQEAAFERIRNRFPVIINVCPSELSPNERHHWVIDMNDYGICKYCEKEKQFTSIIKARQPSSSREADILKAFL